MTKEERDLLLRDLCARLPYHIRCKIWLKDGTTEEGPLDLEHNYADVLLNAFYYDDIKDIKPYLRPMSSMTDEEYDQLYIDSRVKEDSIDILDALANDMDAIDWLNANHFDYRNLIGKGLALEAPKEMHN